MMDPASFAFALVGALDLCLKYGKSLYTKCKDYKHAPKQIQESLLALSSIWYKIEKQLDYLRAIWDHLGERYQGIQSEILIVLESKLLAADAIVQSFFGDDNKFKTALRKLRYTLWAKESLDRAKNDLLEWQKTFDPTWYLTARISAAVPSPSLSSPDASERSSTVVIKTLRSAQANRSKSLPLPLDSLMFLSEVPLHSQLHISFSKAKFIDSNGSGGKKLIDPIKLDPDVSILEQMKDSRDLAKILNTVDPFTFGLLGCDGIALRGTIESPSAIDFVFDVPSELTKPRSLRALLQTAESLHNLQDRFNLARSLAKSVIFLHNSRIVHKNICPETIIVFQDSQSTATLGVPFLVGFERFRFQSSLTLRRGDTQWEKNLYRHPSRQGIMPEEDFKMQHDIYSLGVCLLEIGLWSPFVYYDLSFANAQDQVTTQAPGPELKALRTRDKAEPLVIKDRLVDLTTHLPSKMGQRYANVVHSCLTCLDVDNIDFAHLEDREDTDAIEVGVQYIQKILMELEAIRV